ncbi:MAG: hypothetical protein COV08_01325 [Candidatus Vogelbacteria bacterium CG10_big_fil_rev_8_21_14_0_10_49_38]|uniref:Cohesin domain-containing protein n=1 Tax=Candidatus Vogelbacteria bacterium CG10_big_fil_rev_8_21_14_0_10_49_38 TaxID=1975043 RepID=A0A2H0RI16_9BACT|nr:MAG: hypothetical protein BK006_01345 [bacterium CG10_49_38]PIR46133.1 MAG: hypothetical protein COV08_01325 [Candidatus Vogelbacteria bacterium CG10_big_fil_rev_8_21_14_0_10_49_38]
MILFKNKLFYLAIILAGGLWWPVGDLHSATVSWSVTPLTEPAGAVRAEIFLDTETAKINTVGGEISFAPDRWRLVRVSDANSLVNFWLERPALKTEGSVSFSGIIPGGYVGRGRLFELTFVSLGATPSHASDVLKVRNFTALLNDGTGAETPVRVLGLVSSEPAERELAPIGYPEPFTPMIVKSDALPTADRYVIFATQDKFSGLSYYAVYESWWPVFGLAKRQASLAWVRAESPYRLSPWSPFKHLYVKAVNQGGGARIARVSPQFWLAWVYQPNTILVIILGVILAYVLVRKKWH